MAMNKTATISKEILVDKILHLRKRGGRRKFRPPRKFEIFKKKIG